jgi:hypothetical protein
MAGWLGIASCRDDRLVMLSLTRGCGSLTSQLGAGNDLAFRQHRHKLERMHSDHFAQGQHQQPAALRWNALPSQILPCPASRPDYRIIRLVASAAELVTNQGPEGLFISRRVADHKPIGAAGAVQISSSRWIASGSLFPRNFSIVDSLAGSRTRRYHTTFVRRRCTFTHGGARYDYTRNVELLTDTYPPLRHHVLATSSEIRYMGTGRKTGPPSIPRLRTSSCHKTLFSIILR